MIKIKSRGRTVFCAGVIFLLFCPGPVSGAHEFDAELNLPARITVTNPGADEVPSFHIVAGTRISGAEVKHASGITVNGVRLSGKMLTGSVLVLHPDGSGRWGYETGHGTQRRPDFDEEGNLMEPGDVPRYAKARWDPLTPREPGWVTLSPEGEPLRYGVEFPEAVRADSFTVSGRVLDYLSEGSELLLTLYGDRDGREVIARESLGGADGARFPITLSGFGSECLLVELKMASGSARIAHLHFETSLDAADMELPVLKHGVNTMSVSMDEDSSHKARLVLRWSGEKPVPENVFDDFTENRWGEGVEIIEQRDAFTGETFGRFTFPADPGSARFTRVLDEPLDLSGYTHLRVAVRARDGDHMIVRLGLGSRGSPDMRVGMFHVSTREDWSFLKFDMTGLERGKVDGFFILFQSIHGYPSPRRQGRPLVYEIDTLSFTREKDAEGPAQTDLPAHVADHVSPLEGADVPARAVPPIGEWFPMGFYGGLDAENALWMMDRMTELNMNTVYSPRLHVDTLARAAAQAQTRGIRFVIQGLGGSGMFWRRGGRGAVTVEDRARNLEGAMSGAKRWIPEFRDLWATAAWSISEEIHSHQPPEITPMYDLIRELAPNQPPTVLHNTAGAQGADLEINRPEVTTYDFYPFFWNPLSGPSNPGDSIDVYRRRLASHYENSRKHGSRLWMMPQAWGSGSEEMFGISPGRNFARVGGMRRPEPGEMKLQGWVAVAEGATGIMYYNGRGPLPHGRHQLWDYPYRETGNTRAAGELFASLGRVAPLLVRMERDYRELACLEELEKTGARFGRREHDSKFASVTVLEPGESVPAPGVRGAIVHSFAWRGEYRGNGYASGRFVVLASLNGFERQVIGLALDRTGDERVYDMVRRKDVTGELERVVLEAGEGMVLLLGSEHDFTAVCGMIDEEVKRYYAR